MWAIGPDVGKITKLLFDLPAVISYIDILKLNFTGQSLGCYLVNHHDL